MTPDEPVQIASRDYWFKIIEMLQQNWALIDTLPHGGARVWFVSDGSGVFDEIDFPTVDDARRALRRNGFLRYADEPESREVIAAPDPPFSRWPHPSGPIYSSGKYWKPTGREGVPPLEEPIRLGQKLLRMVLELHLRGYQRLRIAPGEAPSGTSWRCSITSTSNMEPRNGALMRQWRDCDAHYSSTQRHRFFGWRDARHASPSRLADLFLERFPVLAREGRGSDWPYGGWYVEMLHLTYPDVLPVAYADWVDSSLGLPCRGLREGVVVPPPPRVLPTSIQGPADLDRVPR